MTPEIRKLLLSVSDDLEVHVATLSEAMTKQAGLYCLYGMALGRALREERSCKFAIDKLEAVIWRRLHDRSSERLTERVFTTACATDPGWKRAKQSLNDAMDDVSFLETVCRSFEHKRDMVINLSASVRAEMSAELSMRQKKESRDGR